MLKALDRRDPHSTRLRGLLTQFRAQEVSMTTVLQELQAELDYWHREATLQQLSGVLPVEGLLRRCRELQDECDLLATEIVHVRMAISGTGEELADHEGRVLHAGSTDHRRLAFA